jgi:hypothetical protein
MDWFVIGGVVLGGYLMLNVLSSERITRAHQINAALGAAAVDKAKAAVVEVPIALASELGPAIPAGAGKSKR